MTVYELIKAKRDGRELSRSEIESLVSCYVTGVIPDYQMSAFLMAVWFRGMTGDETVHLTQAIMNSGRVLDLSAVTGPKIDKHSTGGVGDKVSLALAPMVAACGVKVPMVSGRGLGHTGGTLDKLESIPGFRTNLTGREFRRNLQKVGCAMMGAGTELAPADRKLYALRDVTATVDSIPLIASSIMAKKMAEGIDALVLDVTTGNGAFMVRPSDARRLARTMIEIGATMGKRVTALVTDMSQPLGRAVGNALEVIESIELLKGHGEPDLTEVTFALGEEMLVLAEMAASHNVARAKLRSVVVDGSALGLFRKLIRFQGGDESVVDDYARLPTARCVLKCRAPESGFVQQMDTFRIGMLGVQLGAGRQRTEDRIDPAVGFWFRKKTGERVERGEVLVDVLANDRKLGRRIAGDVAACYRIGRSRSRRRKVIVERIVQ